MMKKELTKTFMMVLTRKLPTGLLVYMSTHISAFFYQGKTALPQHHHLVFAVLSVRISYGIVGKAR